MVWSKCNIVFNTGITGVFYSGDIVTGYVVIEFNKRQAVEFLLFEIAGESEVQWTRASPTAPYVRHYSRKERILEIKINLNGLKGNTVQNGVHQTNFMFTLPAVLPSTFEGSAGFTKYWAKIESKSPYWFKKTETVPIVITTRLDLNQFPEYLTPYYHQIEKEFMLFGKLVASVKVYTGFAPGQTIPCEITIINESQVTISKIKLVLIQHNQYNSSNGYTNEEKRICFSESDKLASNKQEVCTLNLLIDPCVPSTINFMDPLISLSYVLRVEIRFPYHLAVIENIPVTVGSTQVQHLQQS